MSNGRCLFFFYLAYERSLTGIRDDRSCWQEEVGSGDIQNFFKVGGVVGVGAEVGVDGGFFEGLGLLLDVLAVKTIETAEVCLKLTTDILEIT